MTTVEQAIESAYQSQVTNLYNALSQAILGANDNVEDIAIAEASFKKGLAFAADIKARALNAASQ